MYLFNTRSNQLDKIDINDIDQIGIYTCGPTVYQRVHIGNLRTFFWSDMLVGVLNEIFPDKDIKAIINITDVDDKIIDRLPEKNVKTLLSYTSHYTQLFLDDLNKLNITRYNTEHYKVTDTLHEIKQMIEILKEKDYAYTDINSGDIYFDTSKREIFPFPNHQRPSGKISSRTIIKSDSVKNSNDFILWKQKKDIIEWTQGRCGWHIECSAIAEKHLKNVTFHVGGEDLKFPHHTCEILQSEGYNDTIFGKYWMHVSFLNLNDDKMSKSIGNIMYLNEIKNSYLLRYYFLTKHYRTIFEFDVIEMNNYIPAFMNLHFLYIRLKQIHHNNDISNIRTHKNFILYEKILASVSNDLNTLQAINDLNKWVSYWLTYNVNLLTNDLYLELEKTMKLLKLIDISLFDIPENILNIKTRRDEYRINKNYKMSDEIRIELNKLGYLLEDTSNDTDIITMI